jgi:thiol-disulfide isomerase/thioredoxin
MSQLITETSHKKGSLSASLMDIFGGFSGFVAVKVVSISTRQHQDIRPFLIATCLAFSIASFYRAGGRPSRIPTSALLVALGGIMPAIVINRLGMSWTAPHLLFLFVVTSTASVALGASLRTLILLGRMRLALSLGGISMIAALLLVLRTVPSWLASDAYRHVDQNISAFHVQSFEGKNLSSSDWKGHVVIVSFWATWCLPCQAELPEIAAVQNRYRQNPNVVILALNSGTDGDTPTKAQAFLERKKLGLVGAIDLPENQDFNSDAPRSAATSLGMKTMPVLYILDSSGKLRVIHSGFDSSEPLTESLSREIDGLLFRTAT